jgi:hypothetical protein
VLELISRLGRLFWEVLDRVDYAIMLARCWAVDRICGPEPPTWADRQREAYHERLRKAFPVAAVDGTTEADNSSRSNNNTKSFNSPYRKNNVRHWWRRFYVWTLWTCHLGGFRSFDGQRKSGLSMQDL